MTKDQRIADLQRGIASPSTPDHIRANMKEMLDELLAPEPEPIPDPPAPKPKPTPKPKAVLLPPPPPPPIPQLTAEQSQEMADRFAARRERRISSREN